MVTIDLLSVTIDSFLSVTESVTDRYIGDGNGNLKKLCRRRFRTAKALGFGSGYRFSGLYLGLIVGATLTGTTDGNRLPVAYRSVCKGFTLTVTESLKSPVTEFITDYYRGKVDSTPIPTSFLLYR
jgi:hypothetical protein